jgi:hypothetical protein
VSDELKVVAWLTSWQKDRARPAGSIVNRSEPQQKFDCNRYDPLVRLSDVEAEIAALKEDAERLDYLQNRAATVEILPDGSWWKFRIGGLHSAQSPNIRAAIDSARAAGDGEGKR